MITLEKPEIFNPKFEATGVYVLVEGKLLLMKRSSNKSEPNTYDLPGGKVEIDEMPLVAAQRELFEEAQIECNIDDLKFQKTFYVTYDTYEFVYHTYFLELDDYPKVTINSEHTEYLWITPKEALNLPLIPDEDNCLKILFNLI